MRRARLPDDARRELHERYTSITTEPDNLKFIDRLVADSRTVALNHTAGLSLAEVEPNELLFRLAEDFGVVLLPGRGFGTRHPSGRVSLANLNESDYAKIGRSIRKLFEEYVEKYNTATGNKANKHVVKK